MRQIHLEGPTWHDTKPGWHEISINLNGHEKRYWEVLEWLYASVDKTERHCRWFMTVNGIKKIGRAHV